MSHLGGKPTLACYPDVMHRRPFAPDTFVIGLLGLGLLLLLFPLMRVAALIALSSAVAYWITMGVIKTSRR